MGQKEHQYGNKLRKIAIDFDTLKLDCKPYYPQNLVFELMMPKELLKKHAALKKIHKIIDVSKDAGLISRQEIVSMLPPILCDIHSHHAVLDMCAAPGSKTA
jgi:multisite-specific tRNA:(cytosine-C5)-methyltransferase